MNRAGWRGWGGRSTRCWKWMNFVICIRIIEKNKLILNHLLNSLFLCTFYWHTSIQFRHQPAPTMYICRGIKHVWTYVYRVINNNLNMCIQHIYIYSDFWAILKFISLWQANGQTAIRNVPRLMDILLNQIYELKLFLSHSFWKK